MRALLTILVSTSVTYAASYPVLTYSTYLRDGFTPNAIATDPAGNVYLGGTGIIDPANSMTGAMVVKLNPQTNQYFYVSFLNGQSGQVINAIAADAMGNAYVAGSYVSAQGASQAFAAKLDPSGNTVYFAALGAGVSGSASAIAVTASGEVLVSGTSWGAGFPSTAGAYSVADTTGQPWLLKLDASSTKTVFFRDRSRGQRDCPRCRWKHLCRGNYPTA